MSTTTMKHYDQAAILDAATPVGAGWSCATITLKSGETAYSGTSERWWLVGPGTVTYLLHPAGWQVSPAPTVTRISA